MRLRSLPVRIAILVTASFAIVLLVASLFLVQWFEGRLLAEVTADDAEELDRQVEILQNIELLLADEPEGLDELDEGGLLALIPDDGTYITIHNADGTLIGDSIESFQVLTTSNSESIENFPVYEGMTEEEVLTGLLHLSEFYELLLSELSPETLAEFELVMQIMEAEVIGAADLPLLLEESERRRLDQYQSILSDLIFGAGTRSAAPEGRLVASDRVVEVFGESLTIRAESRVAGIDQALGAIKTVLWFANPMLLALVAGMAYVAARRALQPVAQITTQVDQIRSADSSERVPVPANGDEIAYLAVTMNKMLDRLERSSLSQRQFVSDLSHELRTPAAVIRAEVEAALADPANDWDTTGRSVLVEQSRLSALVDDLILLARLDEDRVSGEGAGGPRLELDLDDLVRQEAARGWDHPVSTRNVQPVRIEGDPRQLGRLVQNLLANADRHATSTIEVSLCRRDGVVVLRVDDDGQGVPEEERDRVFDRFTRLDEGRVRDVGGSGLGLAIVKEVAQAHGGLALVRTNDFGGARFEIQIMDEARKRLSPQYAW